MWFEYEFLKTKQKVQKEVDPDLRFNEPKGLFDKIWVGVVWLLFLGLAAGMVYQKM